jgi:hypothetical protein
MSIKDEIQKNTEQYGVTGGQNSDYFNFEPGENKIRVLTNPGQATLALHFFGKGQKAIVCIGKEEGCSHHKDDDNRPSIKLVAYIIDRKDGKIKLAELPLSIGYALNDLQENSEYTFADCPMPYDVTVTHDPDNTDPKSKYRLTTARQNTDLTEEEQREFDEAMSRITPHQYIDKRKAKARPEPEYPTPESEGINPDEMPFN